MSIRNLPTVEQLAILEKQQITANKTSKAYAKRADRIEELKRYVFSDNKKVEIVAAQFEMNPDLAESDDDNDCGIDCQSCQNYGNCEK